MTENSAITAYFKKIGNVPLLTKDQEFELFEKARNGDGKARNEIIERNLKLVIPTAKQYIKCGIPFADLVQEGNAAVMHACDKFDHKLGHKFSTYATYWIKHNIGRYVKKHFKNVFVPEYVVNLAVQVNKAKRSLMQDGIDNPSTDEIWNRLKRDFKVSGTKKNVKEAIEFCQSETSMSVKIGDDCDTELGDMLEDETAHDPSESTESDMKQKLIANALSALTDGERTIIALRYGVGQTKMTVAEIAEKFGIDESDVSRIAESEAKTLVAA